MQEKFRLEFYDEDKNMRYQVVYFMSEKGYFYSQYCFEDGFSSKVFRISEKDMISAIEYLHNA